MARDSGEPVLANVARRKAEALDVEGVTTSNPGKNGVTVEAGL